MRLLSGLFLFLFVAITAPQLSLAQVQQIDGIVAVVDGDVVLTSELGYRINSIKTRFQQTDTELPPDAVLQSQVLDILIMERLQLAAAHRAGIQISDDQLTQTFSQMASNNGLSPDQLLARLVSEGQTPSSVFRDLRQELTIQQVQQASVNRRIFVSETEIDNFLASAEGQFWSAPTYNLQHILIPLSANADPQEVINAQTLANSIDQQLNNGSDFGTLAVQFSSGPAALEGGNIGWRRAVEFQSELGEVIENAELGIHTKPLRAAGGIHLFKILDFRGGDREAMILQTKARHILLKPNTIRSDEETRQEITELRERILNGEDFSELAREHSEDIGNALRGGDLDWVFPGVMVPEFEEAMNEAEANIVSQPIKTDFGWHIILVEDRRDVDMSNEILRDQARNVIRSRRFDEELDLWQREIRSDSFIDIAEQ